MYDLSLFEVWEHKIYSKHVHFYSSLHVNFVVCVENSNTTYFYLKQHHKYINFFSKIIKFTQAIPVSLMDALEVYWPNNEDIVTQGKITHDNCLSVT